MTWDEEQQQPIICLLQWRMHASPGLDELTDGDKVNVNVGSS